MHSQSCIHKRKSTHTALHEVVRQVKASLAAKQYTLVAFLDREEAFNNVKTDSILKSLLDLDVKGYISSWIASIVKSRWR